MEINLFRFQKSWCVLLVIGLMSCTNNNCDCEKFRYEMSKITISIKSIEENDIEIESVGEYCCSRAKGDNDWTCILKKDAQIISNYRGEGDEVAKHKYNLGFLDLSIDVFNVDNIQNYKEVGFLIDSIKRAGIINPHAIFFDDYPRSLFVEFKDTNGFLIKKGALIQKEDGIWKLVNPIR